LALSILAILFALLSSFLLAWMAVVVFNTDRTDFVDNLTFKGFLTFEQTDLPPASCASVPVEYRFDCDPDPNTSIERCAARGCCWQPPHDSSNKNGAAPLTINHESASNTNVPYCFYPSGHRSHKIINATREDFGYTVFYGIMMTSGYPGDAAIVRMDLILYGQGILRIKVSQSKVKFIYFIF